MFIYILLPFVKLQFDTRKIIIMRKTKNNLKNRIFVFFTKSQILRKRKNCFYIIIYRSLSENYSFNYFFFLVLSLLYYYFSCTNNFTKYESIYGYIIDIFI